MTLVKHPTSERISFSSVELPLSRPDFLDIQLRSFQEFFQLETNPENRESEGLFKVFSENFPITDTRNQFVLEFLDYFVDPPDVEHAMVGCTADFYTGNNPFFWFQFGPNICASQMTSWLRDGGTESWTEWLINEPNN